MLYKISYINTYYIYYYYFVSNIYYVCPFPLKILPKSQCDQPLTTVNRLWISLCIYLHNNIISHHGLCAFEHRQCLYLYNIYTCYTYNTAHLYTVGQTIPQTWPDCVSGQGSIGNVTGILYRTARSCVLTYTQMRLRMSSDRVTGNRDDGFSLLLLHFFSHSFIRWVAVQDQNIQPTQILT